METVRPLKRGMDKWKNIKVLGSVFQAVSLCLCVVLLSLLLSSCDKSARSSNGPMSLDPVGVVKVTHRSLAHQLRLSSELIPFQDVSVYAKVSGYVKDIYVDYGSYVKKGQLLAILEIPELEDQINQDKAAVKQAMDEIQHTKDELNREMAEYHVLHLEYQRLLGVAQTRPGLVAQQEIDDAQGKDLAEAAKVSAYKAALSAAEGHLAAAKAMEEKDQTLLNYSKITAPFTGVVTARYANTGDLMQAGTNSKANPLVRLSQNDHLRLVIQVPESFVPQIHIGDPVEVRVPSLGKSFKGTISRFADEVDFDTRTMHTEVDIPNPQYLLVPGMYAEAVMTLKNRNDVLAIPLQAVSRTGDQASVYIVNQQNKIEKRSVELGLETSNYVEVISGLHENDLVVVSDQSGFRPGQLVQPKIVQLPGGVT